MSAIDNPSTTLASQVPDLAVRLFGGLGLQLTAGTPGDGSDPAVPLVPDGPTVGVSANLVGADGRVAGRLVVVGSGSAGGLLASAEPGAPSDALLGAITAALSLLPVSPDGLLADRLALTDGAVALSGIARANDPTPVVVPLLDGDTHVATVAVAFTSPGPAAAPLPPLSDPTAAATPMRPLSTLGEVQLAVSVEFGRTELTLRDLLGLQPGAVVQLDRAVSEPVDVFANGTMIARGEMVLVDGAYGVRITELVEGD